MDKLNIPNFYTYKVAQSVNQITYEIASDIYPNTSLPPGCIFLCTLILRGPSPLPFLAVTVIWASRVLGIPIHKTLVIWVSPVTLTPTQIAKVM